MSFRQVTGRLCRVPRTLPRTGAVVLNTPQVRFNLNLNKPQSPEVVESNPSELTSDEGLPWYLRDNAGLKVEATKEIPLPAVPEAAGPEVKEFLNLLAYTYGITDLKLFNLADLEDEHTLHPSNQAEVGYVIVGSGKLEKHIYKVAQEMRTYIKHTFDEIPQIEGMVSSAISPKQRRRMLKRARKGPMATDNDYGRLANLWVVATIRGIEVHMLTPERRKELMLEELFCPDSEKHLYLPAVATPPLDDIFIGIRRLHTSTRYSLTNSHGNVVLRQEINQLADEILNLPRTRPLTQMADNFGTKFQELRSTNYLSDEDYNIQFKVKLAIHMVDPEKVTFQELVNDVIEKHSHPSSTESPEDDLIRLMQFSIDSCPSNPGKHFADDLLTQTSEIITKLFRFQNPNLVVTNPMFVWLLVRMCYRNSVRDPNASKTIDEITNGDLDLARQLLGKNYNFLVELALNRLRDVCEVVIHQLREADRVLSPELKEGILFAYGNGGNWREFWKWWRIQCQFLDTEADKHRKWVRLVVYLALRSHKAAQHEFLTQMWDDKTLVLMRAQCQDKLLGAELAAVIAAMEKIVKNLGEFDHVVEEARQL